MSNEKFLALKARARKFSVQLPFMDGREKGNTDELLNTVVTITDYGFLPSDDGGQYAVFIIKEVPNKFFFGGKVMTDNLLDLEADPEEDWHSVINEYGMPTLMKPAKGKKSNRAYVSVEFFPEV